MEEDVSIFVGNPLDGDIFAQVMEMNSAYRVSIINVFQKFRKLILEHSQSHEKFYLI